MTGSSQHRECEKDLFRPRREDEMSKSAKETEWYYGRERSNQKESV